MSAADPHDELNMDQDPRQDSERRAEARTARRLALIFGALIVLLIAAMAGIDIYADNLQEHNHDVPADAAGR